MENKTKEGRKIPITMITLYDCNCNPICDGVTEFFTNDVIGFRDKYYAGRKDENSLDRFNRSLNGEIVTDYYSDDPNLNIIQKGEMEVFWEKDFVFDDSIIETEGCWAYYYFYVSHMIVHVKSIEFKGKYYLVAKYRAEGICDQETHFIFSENDSEKLIKDGYEYDDISSIWGNKIIDLNTKAKRPRDRDKAILDKNYYHENTAETFCYKTLWESKEKIEEFDELPENMKEMLLRDIIGDG